MHVYMYMTVSSFKMITDYATTMFLPQIQVSQDGFMLRIISMFMGCDFPIQLLLHHV